MSRGYLLFLSLYQEKHARWNYSPEFISTAQKGQRSAQLAPLRAGAAGEGAGVSGAQGPGCGTSSATGR